MTCTGHDAALPGPTFWLRSFEIHVSAAFESVLLPDTASYRV